MTNFEKLRQQIQELLPDQTFSEVDLTLMANDLIKFFATIVRITQESGAKENVFTKC